MKITVDTKDREDVKKAIELLKTFLEDTTSSEPSNDFSLPGEGMNMFDSSKEDDEVKEEEQDRVIPYQ